MFIHSLLFLATLTGQANQYRVGNIIADGIPDIPISIEIRLEPYQQVRSAIFLDWLPQDKGMLVKTRFSETGQVHAVELPKNMRRQITFFKDPVNECKVCPDVSKTYFLFTKDSAGNEADQIYKGDYSTGAYTLLSDGISKFNTLVWSRKGDKFAFCSEKRNGRDFDIYLGDPSGSKKFTQIMQEGGYWYPVEFSPDDRRLLAKKYVSSDESYYYILDIGSRELTPLQSDTAKIDYGPARWSPDMKGIYVVADLFSNFKQLLYYDMGSKTFEILTQQIPWDIGEIEISPSGNTVALTSNENGYDRLYFIDTKTRGLSRAQLPDAQIFSLQFKPGTDQLAISLNTATAPSDVYSLNLGSTTLLRWTYSEVGGLDASTFIAPSMIYYKTFDSVDGEARKIPAFYYRPKAFKPPYPVLIDCHGGPAIQEKPYFSYLTQFYLNEMGIAVIAPNVRGSSGYGREFMMLDDGIFREDAVKDIGALLDWIGEQPELDAQRVGIMGGSYGGYMALASMVHYNNRLKCGIDAWGISNFVTFLENTGKYRQDLRREEYGNERDPKMREFLNRISPLSSAPKITKPMFVVQGLQDPRVPVSEAEQIVDAVRKNGGDVWYLLAEDEGHGFGKRSNRDFFQRALILFLEKYLLQNGN